MLRKKSRRRIAPAGSGDRRSEGDRLNRQRQSFTLRASRIAFALVATTSLWSCTTAGNDAIGDVPGVEAASNLTDPNAPEGSAAAPVPTARPGEESTMQPVVTASAEGQSASGKTARLIKGEVAQAALAPQTPAAADAPPVVADAEQVPAKEGQTAVAAVDPAKAGDGSVLTAAAAEAAPPKKKGGLFAFFNSGSKPKAPSIVAPAQAAPVEKAPATPSAAAMPAAVAARAVTANQPAEVEMAALNAADEEAVAAPKRAAFTPDDDGLPGVRQSALFDIKRRSGVDDDISDVDIYEEAPPVQLASAGGMARMGANGLMRQNDNVDVGCLKPGLVRLLRQIEARYGKKLVVTSGYRSPGHNRRVRGAKNSQHMYCAAADIQVPGVGKAQLANFVRAMPGRGGVGTYCHTNSIHIDVGPYRDWNWRCRGRRK